MAALLGGLDGVLDEILRSLGGLVGLGGQGADLVGYHSEALAGGAGPGGLHGGVQRQDIGLEGDVLNSGNDLVDLLGGVGDVLHGGNHLLHLLAAQLDLLAGQAGVLLGDAGGLHVGLGGVPQVLQGGLKLLDGAGLLGSALGKVLRAVGQGLGVAGYLLLRLADLGEGLGNVLGEALDRGFNGPEVADKGG